MDMSPQRWAGTTAYIREVFAPQDAQLRTLMPRAIAAGFPNIAVAPEVGRLLTILASTTNEGRGPRIALELGTLAGYSGIHIARALAPSGKLITIEYNPTHARFAQGEFAAAGLSHRVEIRQGAALDVLPALARDLGLASVDFAFVDAVKTEYPAYFEHLRPLIRPSGLIAFDNALGSSNPQGVTSWWIDDPAGESEVRKAVDQTNRAVAADPWFQSMCIPIGNGLLIARRNP